MSCYVSYVMTLQYSISHYISDQGQLEVELGASPFALASVHSANPLPEPDQRRSCRVLHEWG